MQRSYLIHGAAPALVAACCFACMATLVKLATADTTSQVLVFMRSLFGFIIVAPFALAHGWGYLRTTRVQLHMVRAVLSIAALSCFYFAVSRIGLGEAILLNASSPLFIGIFAVFMLGEHLGRLDAVALAVGFLGVLLLLKPGSELFQVAAVTGAFSGIFVAFAKILIRQMSDTEPVLRTVFYFGVFSSVFSFVPLLWAWQAPSRDAVLYMCGAAVFATIGQTTLTYAFSHNRAASVAPFSYVTVLLGGVVGWVFWDELPDLLSVVGATFVIAGCLGMVWRQRRASAWRAAEVLAKRP